MIESIIRFSVKQKLLVGLLLLGLIGGGIYSLRQLPINAVPDITNNQVQVVTVSPSLAPQEVEQLITYPVEIVLANIPDVIEIRSISRYGLSVITVVFEEQVEVLDARQYVKEQISLAAEEIPSGYGQPELMPITTGLGEIYQYVLRVKPGYEDRYDPMKLRTIQDWIVKRQLSGIEGIIEISSFGGYLKQYEVAIDPPLLRTHNLSLTEVYNALARNNQNSGGSYIEKRTNAYYIRTEGMVEGMEDIENIVVARRNKVPVLVKDVAKVQLGSPKRFGAMTMDGEGEAVGGITLMLKGANSSKAVSNVRDRVEQVRKSLPEGIELYPYLDRADLVAETIETVRSNLIEGGLIVIAVLILLLGNWRAGVIVASIIPMAMLFAIILMNIFGVTANLMSLGAIDFGIVVDGAVIIVEGVLFALVSNYAGQQLSQEKMDEVIIDSSSKLFRSAVFGVFIILVVFVPIITLTGVEGKMFRPMALTFSFAVLGALLLSLTYVPMMAAVILPNTIRDKRTLSDRLIDFFKSLYRPTLRQALRLPVLVLSVSAGLLVGAFLLFRTLGAEFIPTLEEGDLAMQMTIQPGSSLQESIQTSTKAEKILLRHFPEVEHVVSKIGTAEVPTDPMPMEDGDIMIILKPKAEWTTAKTREGLVAAMKDKLSVIAAASFDFTQPIQLRFNELMTGAKTDIAVKIFGEDTETLSQLGDRAAELIDGIPGAADVRAEKTEGLPQLVIHFKREKIAEYGFNIEAINLLIRSAYAGEKVGVVFENERKFDLVVRVDESYRDELDLSQFYLELPGGRSVPASEVAYAEYREGPMQISRENTRRRINVGVNVRNRDVASLVEDIEQRLYEQLDLPAGYSIRFGGDFENLEKARRRLSVAVPVALALIFILLYFTFGRLKYALMIFTAVPMAAIGGIVALWLRGMPFSISAGVGFIALFGVAVLNGIVLISHFNRLRYEEHQTDLFQIIIQGGSDRLRPVLMTATVAALGFLPMALSTSNGAEVQKPLATVVIGGLITATLLTLLVLPVLYYLVNRNRVVSLGKTTLLVGAMVLAGLGVKGQEAPVLSVDSAVQHALQNHPDLQNAELRIRRAELGIEGARRLPPANFNMQAGQINTEKVDYNFSVSQSLGNIAADRQRKEVARADVALKKDERALTAHELRYRVRSDWRHWQYTYRRQQLRAQQLELFQAFGRRADLQYQTGAISGLEKTLSDNRLLQAERALTEAEVVARRSLANLLAAAYLQGNFQPPEQVLSLPQPDTSALAGVFTNPLRREAALSREEIALADKAKAPEVTVGYFNQSIRPDFAFQGVQLGLHLPIFTKSQRIRVQQLQIEETEAENRLRRREARLQRQRERALREVIVLRRQLDEQGQNLLDQAQNLRRLADRRLEEGEVDYFQYLQSQQAALQSELDYLELKHRYNQSVLYYQYLTAE